jgi:serine-type D-Ala-D-Ala carboxypeptidase/endopeptidase (penicillin-binding protein 4)
MRRLLATLLALAAPAAWAAPVFAYDAVDLRGTLTREMRLASPASSAYVRDLDSGRQLFALRASSARVPASVEKLYTTATALLRLGPRATLDTRAVSAAEVDAGGVLRGNLVLVGGGDPFFGDEAAARLARAVRAAGITRIDGAVVGDESGFDGRRSGCCSGYDPDLGGVLSALAYDGGIFAGSAQLDAARFAAQRFAEQLRAAGVRSAQPARAGSAADGAVAVAVSPSLDVRTLIRFINVPSNNFAAEMLLKTLGARYGERGSTGGGAAVVRATLDDIGLRPRVADGSGLSRSDRTTPRDVVGLLGRMDHPDIGGAFRSSLAIAGETGTVKRRMRGSAAFHRCRLKTGTLRTVSALAGYCRTRGGHDVGFALLMNGVASLASAHAIQDRIAAAIARFDGDPAGAPPTGDPAPAPPAAIPAPGPPAGTPAPSPPAGTPPPGQPSSASRPASSSTATPRRSALSSLVPGVAPATT